MKLFLMEGLEFKEMRWVKTAWVQTKSVRFMKNRLVINKFLKHAVYYRKPS